MAKDHIGMVTEAGTSAKMLKKMKLNSVKKVVILGAADVKENHFNVKLLFNRVNINALKVQLSVDLKMANIILGLQNHKSKHPCYICDAANPGKPGVDWEQVDGEEVPVDERKVKLRTLGSIRDNVIAWKNAGAIHGKTMNYKNCVNMPMFEEKDEDGNYLDSDVLTMHLLPPDELHLLLGTNHLYKDLLTVWPGAQHWAAKSHVYKKGSFQEFDGPGCYKLLQDKSLDDLKEMIPTHLHGYVTAFHKLAKIVKGCFSFTVAPTIKDDIVEFRDAYLALNLSVTPKMHIIFAHVYPYLQHKAAINDGKWTGMAVETAQPFEAVHHDFNNRWKNFKVNRENKAKYKESFKRAVCCYVSLNAMI